MFESLAHYGLSQSVLQVLIIAGVVLLCFMLAVSIRYSIILIVSMIALLTLITLSGCSGVPMKNLDYSNGQSISTNPCNFYIGDNCISLR